jgi:hypothetical protein
MSDAVAKICESMQINPATLAADIFRVAMWIEENKNRGFSARTLKAPGVELPIYFFTDEGFSLYDGILFFINNDFTSGWMVRKNPNWRIVWRERYGEIDPDRAALVQRWEDEQAAAKATEDAKPKRKVDSFAEGRFESFTSIQIAYRAAVALVLCRRYMEMRFERDYIYKDVSKYMASVWRQQYDLMIAELHYRKEAEPEPRSSKKKTREAVEDFGKAKELLEAGIEYFFAREYWEQVIESAEEPDLWVDFEHLPRQPLETTPIRWMRESDLITTFMQFVAEDHERQSFEYEDKQIILRTLRKMFARAKGQKIDDDELPIKVDSV